jgi:hypothetical protein
MTWKPEGPATLAQKATGTLPVWARNERVSYHHGSPQYTYLTTFLSSRAIRELATLADAGWEVTIRGRDTGSVHIRINRKSPGKATA